jgi:hypothetical protein
VAVEKAPTRGCIEIYYRVDNLAAVQVESDTQRGDYELVGPVLPISEFDNLMQVLDAAFWNFDGSQGAGEQGMFPRQIRRHDLIAWSLWHGKEIETRACLIVDTVLDQPLFCAPSVPVNRKKLYRDEELPLALFELGIKWQMANKPYKGN